MLRGAARGLGRAALAARRPALVSLAGASLSCAAAAQADCESPWMKLCPYRPSTVGGPWSLQYFPMPGAPGEVVRMLLTLSGSEWKDERLPGVEWLKVKPTTKYGQMPVLTHDDGRVLAQSRAMARYLAKGVKVDGAALYPEDAWLAFRVDELLDAMEDARMIFVETFKIKDQKAKEAARAALFKTDGSGKVFEALKRIDAQAGADGHMVGGKTTLADLWCCCFVNQFRAGFLDGVPTEGWLDELPRLKACVAKTAALPALKQYYAKQAEGSRLYRPFVSP